MSHVHLQNRLFALTSRGALLRMATAVGLAELEQSHTFALIQALRACAGSRLEVMLAQLSDLELRMLANDLDLGGDGRDERLGRLLAFAAASSAPPASGAPVSAAAASAPAASAPPPSAAAVGALAPRAPAARAPAPAASSAGAPSAAAGPSAAAPSAPAAPAARPRSSLFGAPAAGAAVGPGERGFDESFTLMAPAPRKKARGGSAPARLPGPAGEPFVAIDFETADNGRDSACAVALVRVEGDEITRRVAWLIRTPRTTFLHTGVHGITWAMVASQPTFGELWPRLAPVLDGAAYLVAHNAPFDRGVLHACCQAAGLAPPVLGFECTVQMARRLWNPPQAKLPFLCQRFGIPLKHHDAASDAEACARLVIVARQQLARRPAV